MDLGFYTIKWLMPTYYRHTPCSYPLNNSTQMSTLTMAPIWRIFNVHYYMITITQVRLITVTSTLTQKNNKIEFVCCPLPQHLYTTVTTSFLSTVLFRNDLAPPQWTNIKNHYFLILWSPFRICMYSADTCLGLGVQNYCGTYPSGNDPLCIANLENC